jgi:hypothetical protein
MLDVKEWTALPNYVGPCESVSSAVHGGGPKAERALYCVDVSFTGRRCLL